MQGKSLQGNCFWNASGPMAQNMLKTMPFPWASAVYGTSWRTFLQSPDILKQSMEKAIYGRNFNGIYGVYNNYNSSIFIRCTSGSFCGRTFL